MNQDELSCLSSVPSVLHPPILSAIPGTKSQDSNEPRQIILFPFSPLCLASPNPFCHSWNQEPRLSNESGRIVLPLFSPFCPASLLSLTSCIPQSFLPFPEPRAKTQMSQDELSCLSSVSSVLLPSYFPFNIVSLKLKIFLCNSSTIFSKLFNWPVSPYFLLSQMSN